MDVVTSVGVDLRDIGIRRADLRGEIRCQVEGGGNSIVNNYRVSSMLANPDFEDKSEDEKRRRTRERNHKKPLLYSSTASFPNAKNTTKISVEMGTIHQST